MDSIRSPRRTTPACDETPYSRPEPPKAGSESHYVIHKRGQSHASDGTVGVRVDSCPPKGGSGSKSPLDGQHLARRCVHPAMPRRRRSDLAGFPLHITQRGVNRSTCFFSEADRWSYLHWLGRYAARMEIEIHAWVLMTNHVHLLVTAPSPAHVSKLMQSLGRQYVPHLNKKIQRTGTLWEGRYKACPVHAESYLLACMRYIELNPVRASIAVAPGDYRWSSFRRNAYGCPDPLVTEHSIYRALGASSADRQRVYRELFRSQIDEVAIARIRDSTASSSLLAAM